MKTVLYIIYVLGDSNMLQQSHHTNIQNRVLFKLEKFHNLEKSFCFSKI